MKIAVIGANGKAGRKIVQAGLERGLDVWAIVRGDNHSEAEHSILKDLFDLTYDDVKAFDVIVDAIGIWSVSDLNQHQSSLEHLSTILKGKLNRLIVVGGAGSLFMNEEHSLTLSETADFPESFKPLATSMQAGLNYLRTQNEVLWTYLSPAADFQAEGEATKHYQLAGELFTVNQAGESVISYADYAQALIDVALSDAAIQERISVIGL